MISPDVRLPTWLKRFVIWALPIALLWLIITLILLLLSPINEDDALKSLRDKELWKWLEPWVQRLLLTLGAPGLVAAVITWVLIKVAPPRDLRSRLKEIWFPDPPPFLKNPGQGSAVTDAYSFHYWERAPALVGRQSELAHLQRFSSDPAAFRWMWLTARGQGSVGKSRLALEWFRSLHGSWLPWQPLVRGFVQASTLPKELRGWLPRHDTVVIVDDAGDRPGLVEGLLDHFTCQDEAGKLNKRVRVLLVERAVPESLKGLPGSSGGGYQYEALDLPPFSREDALTLVKNLVEERRVDNTVSPSEQDLKELVTKTGGVPLLSLMATQLLLETGSTQWTGKEDLLAAVVTRTKAKWVRLGLGEECFRLLALATLLRGMSWKLADKLGPADCLNKALLDRVFGEDTRDVIPRLTPDLLGEYFVVSYFAGQSITAIEQDMRLAWGADPKGVGRSLLNLILDFPTNTTVARLDLPPKGQAPVRWWCSVRVDLLARASGDDIMRHWSALTKVSDGWRADREIQLTLAQGAVNAISDWGEHGRFDEMAEAWAVLQKVA
ncbi:MAG: hypothetical protein WEB00_11605, partial [Dehalococcoidia bacterium]